jgi:N-acetyl-anhydromuramyl-L-alanine amidase AmpD
MINVYPGALQVPADPSNFLHLDPPRSTFSLIVIHCTDGGPKAENTAAMFATPKEHRDPPISSSAHFVVGQDGLVIQCVDLGDVAYHAHEANRRSVGIEHCARTPSELRRDDPGLPPSDALYRESARLVAWLCRAAGLPVDRDHILGHAEADPATSHRACPLGCGWSWDKYMLLVASTP